jgi:hypothetical protein
MKSYNITCCFIWVGNFVFHIKRCIQIEGVCEQGAEENVLKKRCEVTGEWINVNNDELHSSYSIN